MLSVRNRGRIAGLWYLLLILLGPLRLIYIPNRLFIAGNAAATLNNIAVHERLFRLGIADDLLAALVLVSVTLAFHRLFVATGRYLAALVVIFGGIMPAVLYLTGAAFDLGTINVVRGLPILATFAVPQQHAIAMLCSRCMTCRTPPPKCSGVSGCSATWCSRIPFAPSTPFAGRSFLHRDEPYWRSGAAV